MPIRRQIYLKVLARPHFCSATFRPAFCLDLAHNMNPLPWQLEPQTLGTVDLDVTYPDVFLVENRN